MKVFDILNEKPYEKKDLIKESYNVFLKCEDSSLSLKDQKRNAMILAKEYVKENTILPTQVKSWRKNNL